MPGSSVKRRESADGAVLPPLAGTGAAWGCADDVLFLGDLFWLLKEFGWLMLVPHLSMPAGCLALVCSGVGATGHILKCRGVEDVLPALVTFIWLAANTIWMFADVLLDSPDQQTPWALTPLHRPSPFLGDVLVPVDEVNLTDAWFNSSDSNSTEANITDIIAEFDDSADAMPFQDAYDAMVTFTIVCCGVGAGIYLLGLLWALARHIIKRNDDTRQASIGVLLNLSLCSWCLKDLFWAVELLWPAVVADCVTIVIILGGAVICGDRGIFSIGRTDIAWVLWVISNLLWMLTELAYNGNLRYRWAASAMSLFSFVLLGTCYFEVKSQTISARSHQPEQFHDGKCKDPVSPVVGKAEAPGS